MERVALTAQVREKAGKGVARGLRREKRVPAVLYSHGKSMPISMVNKDVTKILNIEGGEHALIALALRERFGIPVVYEVRGVFEAVWNRDQALAARSEQYARRMAQ